jgi:hypothetical protein
MIHEQNSCSQALLAPWVDESVTGFTAPGFVLTRRYRSCRLPHAAIAILMTQTFLHQFIGSATILLV